MRTICVRKQGNLCTVFVDALHNTPIPFSDFNNPPAHGFPQTVHGGEQGVRNAFPGYNEYRFIEDLSIPPQPTVVPKDRSLEIARLIRDEGGVPPVAKQQTRPAAISKTDEASHSNEVLLDKALGFYKLLLAQSMFAQGVQLTELEIKVSLCYKLILSIWPTSQEALTAAETSVSNLAL